MSLLLVFFSHLILPNFVRADSPTGSEPWRETWIGIDASQDSWLAYSGVTISPFSHIHEEGLRFRFTTGYGHYDYNGFRNVPAPGCNAVIACLPQSTNFEFEAVTSYADILIGYLKRFGELTAKVFIGAAYLSHQIQPIDPQNEVQGSEWGVKSGIELWLNTGPNSWASLDAFYTTAHDTYSGRFRFGYRLLPTVSIGPELAVHGHIKYGRGNGLDYSRGRGGAFARYEWAGGEISASAGASANIDNDISPYINLTWMTRY